MSAPTRWPEIVARRSVVASPHVLASDSGLAALKAGGNALDAAVAAAATIAVVYPHMNGIGGDNVWLIHLGRERRLMALNAAGRLWGEAVKSLRVEDRFDAATIASLRERGHEVSVVEGWSDLMGHAHVIQMDSDGLRAGSDPRADGGARGW